MPTVVVSISQIDKDLLSQLEYAMTFVSEDIVSYKIDQEHLRIEAELRSEQAVASVTANIDELVARYQKRDFGLPAAVFFRQDRDLPLIETWAGLVERRWVTEVGVGHVILRGPAARLMALIDSKAESVFGGRFGAELEIYPSTIRSETLDRCNHFTSFPEHMDFVAHLKQDLEVLNTFSNACRENKWSPAVHDGNMAPSDLAVSPSCCYHCYEGMEGWRLTAPRCITAVLSCHRYEGANHATLTRLRSFTMREVVFIGHPKYVIECRAKAEDLIVQWAIDWELDCSFETANDMFFTNDYSVKASFQRQQQAKKELLLRIPSESKSISVFSSNFHAMSFGKAFDISIAGKPATTGCIAWGLERWVYAIFAQFGFDTRNWPAKLRDEFDRFRPIESMSVES
jgi:seryl-tRNA synthetase